MEVKKERKKEDMQTMKKRRKEYFLPKFLYFLYFHRKKEIRK